MVSFVSTPESFPMMSWREVIFPKALSLITLLLSSTVSSPVVLFLDSLLNFTFASLGLLAREEMLQESFILSFFRVKTTQERNFIPADHGGFFQFSQHPFKYKSGTELLHIIYITNPLPLTESPGKLPARIGHGYFQFFVLLR